MRAKAKISSGFVVVHTAMLWTTMAIASVALWPIYQSLQLVILVAATLAIGSVIAILGALYRLPSHVVMIATIGAYFAFGVPLAIPDRAIYGVLPSGQGILDLLSGTALGWKQLVTITLPVGSFQSLLVPAFVLVLVLTVVALSVALRSRFGELAAVAPVVLLITAILFGPERANWPVALTLGMLATTLIWLSWARWYRRRESIRLLSEQAVKVDGQGTQSGDRIGYRAIISATVTMVIAAAASIAASSLLPVTADREVLRTAIEQPFDPRDYVSPLSGFRTYHQPGTASETMFTAVGLPEDARIRLATLDTYNGIVYSVGSDKVNSASGSFTRVPTSFDQSAVDGEQLSVQITIDQYDGVWMPTIGQLQKVTFTGGQASALRESFFYNDNSGTGAVIEELSSGDSYTLSAVAPNEPSEAQLAVAGPGAAEVPQVGHLPEELAVILSGYVEEGESSGARLLAMIDGLKTDGYISHGVSDDEPTSRSGHAADRITQLLTDQRMIGDGEQYAVTAALMARELGYPARVVFGFTPEIIDPSGVTVVRGDDVAAWVEINTARFGWVTIDPTPDEREIPEEEPEETTQVSRPQSPVQPPPDEPDASDEQLQPDSTQDEPEQPNVLLAVLLAIAQALGIFAVVLMILLSPFIAIVVAKLRRRALRRRAPTPIQRITGGWQEFEDAALDHGYTPPPAPTRIEVAQTVGGVRSVVLAAVADRAVFSPENAEHQEADQVWKSVDELRASLDEGFTRWQRIKARVSVRSLGGYSVKRLFTRRRGA